MGAKISSKKLQPKTINELQHHIDVDFTKDEIQDWYKDFEKHLGQGETALSRTAFIRVYNSLFDGDASIFAGQVFRTFDVDNNNMVDFKEFILGLCMSGSTDPGVKLKWAFSMYDIDQNGYISQDEMNHILNAVCKMTNSRLPEEFTSIENMTKNIFNVLDKNSDNQISLDEFIEGAEKIQFVIDILQCDPAPDT
ncbi:neurocalcin-delta B-like [Mytilus trossulus]|uniref:neurocalcin-delta B-like n=1 Tax=Mytilus trossulus TaxID=6551 RepID=UPI0030073B0F